VCLLLARGVLRACGPVGSTHEFRHEALAHRPLKAAGKLAQEHVL
jgi:hypothetical protein